MAQRPFKECRKLGCHRLTQDGSGYCNEHRYLVADAEAARQKYYDTHRRNKVTSKYYQSKEHRLWSQQIKVRAKGLCEMCSTSVKPVIGNEADHIIPIDTPDGWNRRMDITNGQLLCHACHMKKSAQDREKYILSRTIGRGHG